MTKTRNTVEALLIVEVDEHDGVENICVMPFPQWLKGLNTTLMLIAKMQKNILRK